MYDSDEFMFLMYLKWNDQESMDDIKEAFKVFDAVSNQQEKRFRYMIKPQNSVTYL